MGAPSLIPSSDEFFWLHALIFVFGVFTLLFGLFSYFYKSKLFLSEIVIATVIGIICGGYVTSLIDPLNDWPNHYGIFLEISRLVIGIQEDEHGGRLADEQAIQRRERRLKIGITNGHRSTAAMEMEEISRDESPDRKSLRVKWVSKLKAKVIRERRRNARVMEKGRPKEPKTFLQFSKYLWRKLLEEGLVGEDQATESETDTEELNAEDEGSIDERSQEDGEKQEVMRAEKDEDVLEVIEGETQVAEGETDTD